MERAEFVLGLCRQFNKLPSEILAEPVELLQMLAIDNLGNPDGGVSDG